MSARPSDLLRLRAVVAHVDDLFETIGHYGMTEEQYISPDGIDQEVRRAAVDLYMTQICEEAREVTNETRTRMAGVPWGSVAEMRNYLVHAYESLRAD